MYEYEAKDASNFRSEVSAMNNEKELTPEEFALLFDEFCRREDPELRQLEREALAREQAEAQAFRMSVW